MKFIIAVLLTLLAIAKADIFIRVENVPTFHTNMTKLCDIVLEVESPSTSRSLVCNNASNYEVYTVWYGVSGMKIKNVDGRGFRLAPVEINANLTAAGFFQDPNGEVVVVLNHWKNDSLVIIVLFIFFGFFTILSLWVAASTV
jgi:hypothetical protein